MNTEIDNIKEDIRDIKSDVARDHSALLTLSASYSVVGVQKNLLFDNYKIQMDILDSEVFFAPPKWSDADIIAQDSKSDKVFTAGELANRPNLFTQTSHTPNQLKTFKFLALDANIFVH
ncbi:hypothetical protein AALB53_22645 [Lachnospiraceae bacterium 47-T17]